MTLAKLADAQQFALGSLAIYPLAVPSRGSRELAIWRVELPAGARSGQHSLDREQVIVVGDGQVTLTVDGSTESAGPGDALILPIGAVLELSNDGDTDANATVISPAGLLATAGGHTFPPPWSV